MKINDIITEGIISDLRTAGRQNQADLSANIKQGVTNLAKKIPGAKTISSLHSKLSDYAANAKDAADVSRAADQWISLWDAELKHQNKVRRQSGQPTMTQDEYNKALETWLEQSLNVNADAAKVSQYVRDMNPRSLKNYFQQYFIPQYIKTQQSQPAQPAGIEVPPGQRIVVTHPITNSKYYKTARGWTNETGQVVRKQSSIDYLEDLVANDPV